MSVLREFIQKNYKGFFQAQNEVPEEGIGTKQMSEKWASTVALI